MVYTSARTTYKHNNEAVFIFHHFHNVAEQTLYKLSGLREPAGKQGVRVDL
jgi:hypothetical protein